MIEREGWWREIVQIIVPSSWLEIEGKNSSLFKIFFSFFGTKDIDNLDKTTVSNVKKWISKRNITSGTVQVCKLLANPCVWPQCWQFWTLDDCNVSCWADGTSPIMDFDSWALGLSSPMKNKKKFFWLLWKKMPFFEILHVKWLF